jgi:hypothetical protein
MTRPSAHPFKSTNSPRREPTQTTQRNCGRADGRTDERVVVQPEKHTALFILPTTALGCFRFPTRSPP